MQKYWGIINSLNILCKIKIKNVQLIILTCVTLFSLCIYWVFTAWLNLDGRTRKQDQMDPTHLCQSFIIQVPELLKVHSICMNSKYLKKLLYPKPVF